MSIIQAMSRPAGTRSSSSGVEDAVLVKRLRSGEEGAFEAIFKRHYPPLLSYCRHMLGNLQEAEDALQQAFIRAHGALLKDSPPRELRPWLYAIARNCCLSAIAARRPVLELQDRLPSLVGLSEQVREREDLRELVADIGGLPEDQRSALLLAELDDLSHQQIAGIVGCEVSKVKALVYQARSTLIADRDARNASCQDIREELSVARGGQLRRGPLRRHLKACVGCRSFQEAVNTQRSALALVLPVLPSAGLAARILRHGAVAHTIAAAAQSGAVIAPAGAATSAAAGSAAASGSGALAGGAGGSVLAATAGATGTTTGGAVLGSGVLAKVAVGGALALAATAGAVTTVHHLDHPSRHASTRLAASAHRRSRRGHAAASTAAGAPGLLPVADRTTGIAEVPAPSPTAAVQTPAPASPANPLQAPLPGGSALLTAISPSAIQIAQTGTQPTALSPEATSEPPPTSQRPGGADRQALLEKKRHRLRVAHRRRQLLRRRERLAEHRRLEAERRRHAREERERKAREAKEAKEQRERLREERQRKAQEAKEARERRELEVQSKREAREAREAAQSKPKSSPPAATSPTSTSTTTTTTTTTTSTSTSAAPKTKLGRKTSTTTVTTTSTPGGN
jgi:RNA polymerase sigma factor (sigma-70 family)